MRQSKPWRHVTACVLLGLGAAAMVVSMTDRAMADETQAVRLHAAGSLRSAMLDIAKAFTAAYGLRVDRGVRLVRPVARAF